MKEEKSLTIQEESQRWVLENKGLNVKSEGYDSPRISSEIADCSMPLSFDQMSYCSLGCLYCFAYTSKTNRIKKGQEGINLTSVKVKSLCDTLKGDPHTAKQERMWEHFYSKRFLFHWGGLADPFCNFERNNKTGYYILETLGDLNYPTLLSFKGNTIFKKEYLDLFKNYSKQKNFAFQVSIVTGNEDLAGKVEIGVPTPNKRISAIKKLSDMGYFTILRLRPYIIGISDVDIDDLLNKSLEAGIKGISMEFLAIDSRSSKGMQHRYKEIAKLIGLKDLFKYFKALSPPERGGYMRLNRAVKESHIKKIYKFCVKNNLIFGCSDPDFKELNMSGSCCAMPDLFPDNKDLENWTKSQLTYHFKEARKTYHLTGKVGTLHFKGVYGNESYLDERKFALEHVGIMDINTSERSVLTQRSLLRDSWNNLKSPANPRNYLHGKLLPVKTDENGDLVYKYVPSEYEERWKEEGIDLTK